MTHGFVSYAQNFEDVRLWRAFSDIADGRYLDIGTQDPVRDSVSLAFYQRGWRGVHVEPTPAYAAAMRAARPDETVIEAAVSCAAGPIRFFEIPETGISTGVAELAERHAREGWQHRVITVPTVTLAGLFDLMGPDPIHWLKIDVEGMEADVLQSWGNHPARPAALVIEATAPNTQIQTHDAWYDLVLSRGYRDVLFDGLSRYFIHETQVERGAALALSPNVFDGFQVASSHFVTGTLVAEHKAEIAATQAQAEAERNTQIAALRQQAEAERLQAIAATQAQAEAALHALRSALEARIVAGEQAMAEARQAVLAHQRANLAQARQIGRLEGQLAAQAEATAARLQDAEAVRLELAERLASRERELTEARAALADMRQQTEAMTGEHARSIALANAALAAADARAARLAEQLAEIGQRLTETEAGREQAEQRHKEARDHGEERAAALGAELDRLRAHIAWREGQLAKASRLLQTVPDPLAGWPARLANRLARLAGRDPAAIIAAHAEEVLTWQSDAAIANTAAPQAISATCSPQDMVAGPEFAPAQEDLGMPASNGPITSVPQLLAPHDAAFIRTAYEAVLGRAPDPEGEAYYLERLRGGAHKLEILKQLRRSREGRNFIPGVAGLDRAIKRHHWATRPVIGAVVRLLTGAEGNSAIERQLRVIANEIARLRTEQAELQRAITAVASRPLTVSWAGSPPSEGKSENTGQDQLVLTNPDISDLPTLAAMLDEIGQVTNFEHFLSSFQAAITCSREAAVLKQR